MNEAPYSQEWLLRKTMDANLRRMMDLHRKEVSERDERIKSLEAEVERLREAAGKGVEARA